jgi:hypothetical protein
MQYKFDHYTLTSHRCLNTVEVENGATVFTPNRVFSSAKLLSKSLSFFARLKKNATFPNWILSFEAL